MQIKEYVDQFFKKILDYLDSVFPALLNAILVILIMYIVFRIFKAILMKNLKFIFVKTDPLRIQTVEKILLSFLNYVFAFTAFIVFLILIGVNITAILATFGAAGVVVGIAGQQLVSDLISGFYIIVERYFDVGDYITTKNYEGYVKEIGIKVTILETYGQEIVIIPNSEIIDLKNYSKKNFIDFPEFRIDYKTDIALLEEKITEELIAKLETNPKVYSVEYLGIKGLNDSAITCLFQIEVQAYDRFIVRRFFNAEVLYFCRKHNFEIPYNMLNVHVKSNHE